MRDNDAYLPLFESATDYVCEVAIVFYEKYSHFSNVVSVSPGIRLVIPAKGRRGLSPLRRPRSRAGASYCVTTVPIFTTSKSRPCSCFIAPSSSSLQRMS